MKNLLFSLLFLITISDAKEIECYSQKEITLFSKTIEDIFISSHNNDYKKLSIYIDFSKKEITQTFFLNHPKDERSKKIIMFYKNNIPSKVKAKTLKRFLTRKCSKYLYVSKHYKEEEYSMSFYFTLVNGVFKHTSTRIAG